MASAHPDARSRRQRLDAALDRLSHADAVLVSAPPGHGKSVLLARWRRLLISMGRTVIWVPGKPDLTLQDMVTQICGSAPPEEAGDPQAMLRSFLAAQDRGISIITDDLDRIADAAVLTGLADTLAGMPRGVQWLFASCRPVPDDWLGLLAYATLGVVDGGQLRFTADEAAELLAEVPDPRLIDQADGVPLFLDMLRRGGLGDGSLRRWLDAHVWPAVSAEHRDAIDALALLEDVPLTAELIEAVCGRPIGAAVIDTLRYVTPLAVESGGHLRFHALASSALPGAPLSDGRAGEVHRRAAAWLARRLPQAAIVHALKGGEMELAYRLIEQELRDAVSRGRVEQALEWLRSIPAEALAERGGMDATIAWALAICGRPDDAESWLDEAMRRNPAFQVGGFDALLRALLGSQRDDPDETMRQMARLDAVRIEGLPPQFNAVRLNLTRWLALQAGEPWLPGVAPRLPPSDPRLDPRHFYSLCFAAYRDVESALDTGNAREAIRYVEPLFVKAKRELGPDSAAAFILAAALGAAYRQAGDAVTAAALVADLRIERESWALPSSIWLVVRTRARVARDSGDMASAIEMIEHFVAEVSLRSLHHLAAKALAELARLYAEAGSPARLRSTIDRIRLVQSHVQGPMQSRQIAIPAALAVAHGAIFERDWAVAIGALRHGHVLAARMRRVLPGAEIELLCDMLPSEAPRPRLSRKRMLPLLDAGDRQTLMRDLQAGPVRIQPGARQPEREAPDVTAKEREVLELVAAGVGNKLIAQALMVSPETVKWHLKNIFNKLEVHDRRNVVARARALGIID